MGLEVVSVMHSKEPLPEFAGERGELVRRVAYSTTFEKSPRLRAFFLHVCRCAIEDKAEEATEQQIGIFVYGRQPGYNPNDDNIVRSQARVLRMKLEHHFANEGKDEPVIITIPKGQYLPVFEPRVVAPLARPIIVEPPPAKKSSSKWVLASVALLFALVAVWLGYQLVQSRRNTTGSASVASLIPGMSDAASKASSRPSGTPVALPNEAGEIRIAAGHTGGPLVDAWGHRWDSDRNFEGGSAQPGPKHFFPPVADESPFLSMREANSGDQMDPQSVREFQYNIPAGPGAYELRLYFADPVREFFDSSPGEDAQNERNFEIDLNGHPLAINFDPISDGGSASVDVRVFKDVHADDDGKVHLRFRSGWKGKAFVNAIELTPSLPGKMNPIRIAARRTDFVDETGTVWRADHDFIGGRIETYKLPTSGPKISELYATERFGNFNYSIAVAPGSYTVKLHFMESFFSPSIPASFCQGAGCRVFDVSCNGAMLLQDFDINQAAQGPFKPVIKEFHGLHPNGQGKLLLQFSPKVNYGEIRALEVIDEGK